MVEPLISHGLFYRSPRYVSEPCSCKDPCCLWEGPRALRFHQIIFICVQKMNGGLTGLERHEECRKMTEFSFLGELSLSFEQ